MTDILCRWLNDEVKLSRRIDGDEVGEAFSNGYLFGEILHIHGLQDDFTAFSQSNTSDSKLNNFTRVEPSFSLLGIPFDTNLASDVISKKPGVATRLLYQLFISLGKKNKKNLTGVAMETMRPQGPAKLSNIESGLYKERLKSIVPRQVDVSFDDLIERYHKQQKIQEQKAIVKQMEEEEKLLRYRHQMRQEGIERSRKMRNKQEMVMEKIKEATVKIPKPPAPKKLERPRSGGRKLREAKEVIKSIDEFENNVKSLLPSSSPLNINKCIVDTDIDIFVNRGTAGNKAADMSLEPASNDQYVDKIRNRLNQDAQARKEREKRRRRVLFEQMKANEAQEDAKREEMLVNRLMRQSQMERRIAVQLMQVRHEKEVMKQNRLLRERQFTERRMKDFEDALSREAEACRQAKIEYKEELKKNAELHAAIAAERAREKYAKHFLFCEEVVCAMFDFACKVGEYRELTERSLPNKLVGEWKAMFVDGMPLYEDQMEGKTQRAEANEEFCTGPDKLLDEQDYMEYQLGTGGWAWNVSPEEDDPTKPNPILGYIIKRLLAIVYPAQPPPEKPKFPPCPIKACIVGKFFCGKTTAIQHITATHRIVALDPEVLLKEAIAASQNKGVTEICILPEIQDVNNNEDLDETKAASNNLRKDTMNQDQLTVIASRLGKNQNLTVETSPGLISSIEVKVDDLGTLAEPEHHITPTTKPNLEVPGDANISSGIRSQVSKRSLLGSKAFHCLKKGKQVPDSVLVDMVVNAIRNVPEGTGWILDNFPYTANQAKLLEKALTGFETPIVPSKSGRLDIKKVRKSRIAPDPLPPAAPPPPQSGFDLVIHFDIEDDIVLKRAEGRTCNPESSQVFHEEYKPPPEGSYTGVLEQPEVQQVEDPSFDREQIQSRLTGFQDTWPKLEKWFNKFGILTTLYVNKSPGDVYIEVEKLLHETLIKLNLINEEAELKQAKAQEIFLKVMTRSMADCKESEIPKAEPVPIPEDTAVEETGIEKGTKEVTSETPKNDVEVPKQSSKEQKTEGKKGGKKDGKRDVKKGGSPVRIQSKEKEKEREGSANAGKGRASVSNGERPKSEKTSRSPSPRKGSRPSSRERALSATKRGRRSKSPGSKQLETSPIDVPPVPEGPQPGSAEWEYVNMKIDEEIARFLVPKWENVETSYIDTAKIIFRSIREEKEKIIRYFYNTRKSYVEFLTRPDTKQAFVEQWQEEHNQIAEDLREDEDAKAEYYQRVEDLCVRLWDVCDTRKEEAEDERQRIMVEGWLEDKIGVLMNHYLSLMQVEVDRYIDSCTLIRDYYIAMEEIDPVQRSKIVAACNLEASRLPLVELPSTLAGIKESETSLYQEQSKALSAKGSRDKDRIKELKTPDPMEIEDENKRRIPLVQRRPKSSDSPGRDKRDKKATPRKEDKGESPLLGSDNDDKIILDVQQAIHQIIEEQVNYCMSDGLAPPKLIEEKEKEASKPLAKGKKDKKAGGRKSPGKSKTQDIETPPPNANKEESGSEQSEEEKKKKDTKEKALMEYRAAITLESDSLRLRVDLIKTKALDLISELKEKAKQTYRDMNDWLGKRFLDEVESIDQMAKMLKLAIESNSKIQDAVVLEDKEFIVEIDLQTFRTPSPPPIPQPVETPQKDRFTVEQLRHVYDQFLEMAPSGVISVKAFCDTFLDLAACTEGNDALPECWMSITVQQMQEIAKILSWDQENINWRAFLVSASQPFPEITNADLLNLLAQCQAIDTQNAGVFALEDCDEVPLFYQRNEANEGDDADEEENKYDRVGNLQDLFFQIFSVDYGMERLVNYTTMLQYFAAHSNPLDGFLRALSVVTNQPMPQSSDLEVRVEEEARDPAWKEQVDPKLLSTVYVDELLQVFNFGLQTAEETHRFATTNNFTHIMHKEKLLGIFNELGSQEEDCVPIHLLYQHPVMKEYINACQKYRLVNIVDVFKASEEDASSIA